MYEEKSCIVNHQKWFIKSEKKVPLFSLISFVKEKKKEKAITTSEGSQRKDSNFVQSFYHITVKESQHLDDVQDALPQLEDDI